MFKKTKSFVKDIKTLVALAEFIEELDQEEIDCALLAMMPRVT